MSVRSATLQPRPTVLTTPTIVTQATSCYPVGLLSDGRTLVMRNVNRVGVSTDFGATVTLGKTFNDFPGITSFDGLLETPNGEVLASLTPNDNSAPGILYRSTGWNKATANATSWTLVKTFVGNGSYARRSWCLNDGCVAPSWSKHAGAIFIVEYGLPKPTAFRAYMSTDDGVTWREIFNLQTRFPSDTNIHCHSITYDPWQGRVYLAYGDTVHGVLYSDDLEATTPTWTLVPGTDGDASGTYQVTTLAAVEAGIIMLPDGAPNGIRMIPRRAGRTGIGQVHQLLDFTGATSTYIGGTIWRNGGSARPQAGSPIFACAQESVSAYSKPAIFASLDGGLTWLEAYRHATGIAASGQTGIERTFGPTTDGKVISTINVDGTIKALVLDYAPDAKTKIPEQPWTRIMTGNTQYASAVAQQAILYEAGSAAAGGVSGGRGGFYWDPADVLVDGRLSARMKIRLNLDVNNIAPACNFTASLYPVTADAATDGGYTLGTVVPSSSVTISAPSAGTIPTSEVEFDAPTTAGMYALTIVINTNMTTSSTVNARVTLKARGV